MIKSGKSDKTKKSRAKRLRIFAAYLLVIGMAGSGVYADEPEVPEMPEVSDSSEQDPENPGGETPETTETTEEGSSEVTVTTETTETPTEPGTEKPTEPPTERPTTKPTERITEAPTEPPTDPTSETGSDITEETTETTEEITEPEIITYTVQIPGYDVSEILQLREFYLQSQNEVTLAQQQLDKLLAQQNDFYTNLQQLDEMVIDLQTRMEKLKAEQKRANELIANVSYALDRAKEKENEQYERLKEHIQNAYENGNYSMVDAILNAGSFAELLNKPEYVQEVSDYDKKLLEDFQTARRSLADQRLMLGVMSDSAGIMQKVYLEQEEALNLMMEEKQKQIALCQTPIEEQTGTLTKLQTLEQEQAARLAEIESNAWRTYTLLKPEYDGKIFVWPQPSSTYITSDYGYRGYIGIPGASTFHQGIDIRASMYDPVVAAAPGVVIDTSEHGTGGKTVVLDVGNHITLIYHHLNGYAVKPGDTVEAGAVVGYVGMTGVTSGPHLHFSVRVNGQYVDPKPFLGLTSPIEMSIGGGGTESETIQDGSASAFD